MTRMEIPMNMKRNLRGVLAAALVLLLILALAGCGAKGGDVHPSSPAPSPTAPETPPAPTDGYTRVSTVEELVEAIRPQAKIMIEPGRYNLTDFLSEFPNVRDWDAWNEEHEYVQIQGPFDGLELFIRNVRELAIEGGSDDPAETEIVIEPRYAAVLNFSRCTGIE